MFNASPRRCCCRLAGPPVHLRDYIVVCLVLEGTLLGVVKAGGAGGGIRHKYDARREISVCGWHIGMGENDVGVRSLQSRRIHSKATNDGVAFSVGRSGEGTSLLRRSLAYYFMGQDCGGWGGRPV